MLVDGRRFGGLSGEPLGPRYEIRPHRFRRDDPLDALRKLQRATEPPAGPARRGAMDALPGARDDGGEDEFTVWIDDERIRRFQTVDRGSGRSARRNQD